MTPGTKPLQATACCRGGGTHFKQLSPSWNALTDQTPHRLCRQKPKAEAGRGWTGSLLSDSLRACVVCCVLCQHNKQSRVGACGPPKPSPAKSRYALYNLRPPSLPPGTSRTSNITKVRKTGKSCSLSGWKAALRSSSKQQASHCFCHRRTRQL